MTVSRKSGGAQNLRDRFVRNAGHCLSNRLACATPWRPAHQPRPQSPQGSILPDPVPVRHRLERMLIGAWLCARNAHRRAPRTGGACQELASAVSEVVEEPYGETEFSLRPRIRVPLWCSGANIENRMAPELRSRCSSGPRRYRRRGYGCPLALNSVAGLRWATKRRLAAPTGSTDTSDYGRKRGQGGLCRRRTQTLHRQQRGELAAGSEEPHIVENDRLHELVHGVRGRA